MRYCQICNGTGKRVILNHYGELCLFECTSCGHWYVDGLVDQAWFDEYYLTKYKTDDKPYSDERLASLAALIGSYMPKQVLDIGGMDGELKQRLDGITACDVAGVGDVSKKKYDGVILSHTLEHIYDIGAMFDRIHGALKKKGHLFVEIPVHLFDNYLPPKEYDYHWQHINKFRVRDIEALFLRHGFTIELSEQLPDYREYSCWRIVGRNG